jgi:dsRNA-specific ribonuclease
MDESDLTLYKIALVKEETLAETARDIELDKRVFISK